MLLLQATFAGLVHALSILDGRILGQNLLNTPIVEGALIGFLLGDLKTGLVMGATLQLIFMGFVGIGVTSLPNSSAGTILAVSLAIISNLDPDTAIALAMPIALLFQPTGILPRIINNAFNPKVDEAAERGDTRAVKKYYWYGVVNFALFFFVPMFLAVYFGAGPIQSLIDLIPDFILNGLTVASTVLPALGIGLLMSYIIDKNTYAYLFVGFIAASYLGMDLLGIAMIGAVIAFIYYNKGSEEEEF